MTSHNPQRSSSESLGSLVVFRSVKLIYLLICTALFFAYYSLLLREIGSPEYIFHARADLLFAVIYLACLIWLIRVYNGFYFGAFGVPELCFSLSLATTITNFCMYIIVCIYLNRLTGLRLALLLCAIEIIFNLFCAWLGNKLYFFLNPAKKTVIVYSRKSDLEKLSEINLLPNHFNVIKEIPNPTDAEEILPELEGCEAVFVAGVNQHIRNSISKYCLQHDIQVYIEPRIGDVIMSGGIHINRFSVPIVRVGRVRPTPEFLIIKRASDIIFSLIAIILSSPFMLIAALFIKCSDGGPVFYKQTRLTKDGREFEILKFRSMRVDAEKDGIARLASENDSRITPVGRVLRSCRMDELPQLFNVLKGDMSIVGPRPERPEIAAQYQKIISSFDLRLQVKAGITGFAQVYGRYNTEPYDKLQMDLMYINRLSVVNDLWLMFATFKVLFQKGSTDGVREDQITAVKLSTEDEAVSVR